MRNLCVFLLCVFFAGTARAEEQFPFMGSVKTDRVYLRAGQNVNFATIAVVNKGDTLVVLSKSYGWYKVKVPAQTKGYISASYAVLATPEVGEITGNVVNVRAAANTEASIIGKLEKGTYFYVRAKEGDWISIKPVDQMAAWIKEEFLEPVKGAAVPAKLYPVQAPPPIPVVSAPAWTKLLKTLSGDQVQTTGTLTRDEQGVYKVTKDNVLICTVVGPESVLKGFIGSVVDIQGKKTGGSGNEPPSVKISKINLML